MWMVSRAVQAQGASGGKRSRSRSQVRSTMPEFDQFKHDTRSFWQSAEIFYQ
jgi:hypothetical protein